MDYASFKAYLATFLWRQNDADLVANLDSLVRMADAELNRVLDIQRRQKTLLILPKTEDYPLPPDFRHIISLNNNSQSTRGMMISTTLQDLYAKRQQFNSANVMPYYAVDEGVSGGKLLRLIGPFSLTSPGNMTLIYRCNVPDFKATDASWLEADFLDLYTYTVLSHTAPFLKDDERVPLWQSLKTDTIASAIAEDKFMVTHGGSPLQMRPHRLVP
jgi:hypothetical protein